MKLSDLKIGTNMNDTKQKIQQFPFWYHKIDLGDGIITPGWAPLNPLAYQIPERLDGKRVLDVGAWDGYWTFEVLKRGAKEVVAIDDFSDTFDSFALDLNKDTSHQAWGTFDLCREILGYSDDVCKRVEMSIYDLKEETFGKFDIVFFFGVLYHCRYPLLALDILSSVCIEDIYIETAVLDDYSPYKGGIGRGYSNREMVMEFYPTDEYGNNFTNWWSPTMTCLIQMVKSSGFKTVTGQKLVEKPNELKMCRGFVQGKK
jgi:tRNA (mo5U34)-methyltransferase